ncbi:hypothetical protein BJ165DRAFT_854079 [Panaeolus papilionaceus]|nr:hypothetical protein BJ165DRAFT_854079 [Panaeolus papilionaceus]
MATAAQKASAQLQFLARAHRELNVKALLDSNSRFGTGMMMVQAIRELPSNDFMTAFKKLLAFDAIIRDLSAPSTFKTDNGKRTQRALTTEERRKLVLLICEVVNGPQAEAWLHFNAIIEEVLQLTHMKKMPPMPFGRTLHFTLGFHRPQNLTNSFTASEGFLWFPSWPWFVRHYIDDVLNHIDTRDIVPGSEDAFIQHQSARLRDLVIKINRYSLDNVKPEALLRVRVHGHELVYTNEFFADMVDRVRYVYSA